MERTILLVIFLIILIISYEYAKRYELFQSTTTITPESQPPSGLKLIGTSYETTVRLFWHRPTYNHENVYSYLVYMGEPGKDVTLFTIKATGDKLFYEKIFMGLDPKKLYKFKVRAVSHDGVSEDSNIVELYPKNNNEVQPRPIPPLVNRITCQPDGTFKIGGTCGKPIYPSTEFNDENHDELLSTLSMKKKSSSVNF